jgi:hypothetical protein
MIKKYVEALAMKLSRHRPTDNFLLPSTLFYDALTHNLITLHEFQKIKLLFYINEKEIEIGQNNVRLLL